MLLRNIKFFAYLPSRRRPNFRPADSVAKWHTGCQRRDWNQEIERGRTASSVTEVASERKASTATSLG